MFQAKNNRIGFASYRYDDEIGLYYLRARYYDPELGRFTSLDPLGVVPNAEKPNKFKPIQQYIEGLSLYEYAGSNPVKFKDSWGLVCGSRFGDWIVPDKWRDVLFTAACMAHDKCYEGGGRYSCDTSKKDCDEVLKTKMYEACGWAKGYVDCGYFPGVGYICREVSAEEAVKQCKSVADLYFWAVSKFGCPAFRNARNKSKCCLKECLPPKSPSPPPIYFPYPSPYPYYPY